MRIYKSYYLLPALLQNVIFSIYGYYMFRKRYNSEFKKNCEILKINEHISSEKHEQGQLEILKKMLIHCGMNVPYYQKLFRAIRFNPENVETLEDLCRIPLLEKKYVLERPEEFVAKNIKKSNMILEETSGTSGAPLKVYWHKDFYAWIYALYEIRMRVSAGVSLRDRRANLTGKVLIPADQKKLPFWRYNIAEKQLYMSSYHLSNQNIPYYVKALQKFKPRFIIGYPTSIYPIAQYLVTSQDKIPSVDAIISCSEYLLDETRLIIERGFRCKVYNHYGSVEWVTTINECERGNLHTSPEIGIIEILDNNGNPMPKGHVGEIVCTGLLNYAMPFIRYRTGDLGAYPENIKTCGCGRTLPLFKSLEGRKMSYLNLPDGRLVGSAALSTAFHAENIIESQLIQVSNNSVNLKLVVTNNFKESDKEYLLDELNKRLFPLKINCEYVNSIDNGSNAKKQWIINKVCSAK